MLRISTFKFSKNRVKKRKNGKKRRENVINKQSDFQSANNYSLFLSYQIIFGNRA